MQAGKPEMAIVHAMPLLAGDITQKIIGAFHRAHNRLGFGFSEAICSRVFAIELRKAGLSFRREPAIPVWYEGERVGFYRPDFIVAETVVVEIKCYPVLYRSADRQLLNYMRCTGCEVGLVCNFGDKPEFRRLIWTNDRKPMINRIAIL